MKVIGRDIWIGIWCLILSIVSVTRWDPGTSGASGRVAAGVVWERFPKFVIGFFAASVIMSLVAARPPADHVGRAPVAGTLTTRAGTTPYDADFSRYEPPASLADRFGFDPDTGTLRFRGAMDATALEALGGAITPGDPDSEDKEAAFERLRYEADWYESRLQKAVISPVKKLRSWAFVLCFLGIGLSTRFAELATFGLRPFWAFTIGVLVNVPLGYVLSTVVFSSYWAQI
jgi:hypothetical protein